MHTAQTCHGAHCTNMAWCLPYRTTVWCTSYKYGIMHTALIWQTPHDATTCSYYHHHMRLTDWCKSYKNTGCTPYTACSSQCTPINTVRSTPNSIMTDQLNWPPGAILRSEAVFKALRPTYRGITKKLHFRKQFPLISVTKCRVIASIGGVLDTIKEYSKFRVKSLIIFKLR